MKKIIKDKNGNIVGYTNNNTNNGIEDYKLYIKSEIESNNQKLRNELLPVNSILINNISNFNIPGQTWILLKKLNNGETIVGGNTTDGSIKNHNHTMNNNGLHHHNIARGNDDVSEDSGYQNDYLSYGNSDGDKNNEYILRKASGDHLDLNTYPWRYKTSDKGDHSHSINSTGGNKNIPYGLGLGNTYIWKRTKYFFLFTQIKISVFLHGRKTSKNYLITFT